MPTKDNVDVIQALWEALASGDDDRVAEAFAPACELVAPETLPWGGTYVGPDGARDLLERSGGWDR